MRTIKSLCGMQHILSLLLFHTYIVQLSNDKKMKRLKYCISIILCSPTHFKLLIKKSVKKKYCLLTKEMTAECAFNRKVLTSSNNTKRDWKARRDISLLSISNNAIAKRKNIEKIVQNSVRMRIENSVNLTSLDDTKRDWKAKLSRHQFTLYAIKLRQTIAKIVQISFNNIKWEYCVVAFLSRLSITHYLIPRRNTQFDLK